MQRTTARPAHWYANRPDAHAVGARNRSARRTRRRRPDLTPDREPVTRPDPSQPPLIINAEYAHNRQRYTIHPRLQPRARSRAVAAQIRTPAARRVRVFSRYLPPVLSNSAAQRDFRERTGGAGLRRSAPRKLRDL